MVLIRPREWPNNQTVKIERINNSEAYDLAAIDWIELKFVSTFVNSNKVCEQFHRSWYSLHMLCVRWFDWNLKIFSSLSFATLCIITNAKKKRSCEFCLLKICWCLENLVKALIFFWYFFCIQVNECIVFCVCVNEIPRKERDREY